MMAFAAANTNVADAIADVMGMSSAEIIKSHVNWGVTNLDSFGPLPSAPRSASK